MTTAQTKLYWREWAAVRRQQPDADRHAIHEHALGRDVSSKSLTNHQFDHVLAAFRAISRPAALAPQVRALRQPRTRLAHRIQELQEALAVYVDDVHAYVASIIKDKFGRAHPHRRVPVGIDDLSDKPSGRVDRNGQLIEGPSQLLQLAITLDRALQQKRKAAGHTREDLRIRVAARSTHGSEPAADVSDEEVCDEALVTVDSDNYPF